MGGVGSRHELSFRAGFGFQIGRKYPSLKRIKFVSVDVTDPNVFPSRHPTFSTNFIQGEN